MDLKLSGLVAVVTGGSKGIGMATVRTFLEEGARVVASSRHTSADLEALRSPDLIHVPADLTDPHAPARVIATAAEAFGGLDILVNNAGGPPPGAKMPTFGFLAPTDDDWRAMFELNLFSVVRAIRTAIPVLRERGGGSIVNVSAAVARQPGPMNVDYAAAKAALTNLTQALSAEYAPQGIRVNTVSPSAVLTPAWTESGGSADIIAAHYAIDRDTVITGLVPEKTGHLTGRLIDPQEVADMIALLASPRSASTTGGDFCVDAGFIKAV